jgi:nitrite reductase (NO-forming)
MEGIYNPEGGTIRQMPERGTSKGEVKAANLAERVSLGKAVYARTCFACHQEDGTGIPNAFPPLAQSDYLNEDPGRTIETVLKGRNNEITVNGKKYNGVMPAQLLNDEEIANVLCYVYANWGNKKQEITPEMVAKERGH